MMEGMDRIRFTDGKSISAKLLLELYQYAPWAKGRGATDVQTMLEHSDVILSAWDGEKLAGFGRALTDRVYRAILYDIVIRPDYQHQGLGSSLVEHLLNHPLIAKVPVISLFTRDRQDFYKKLGFVTNHQKGLTGMILVRGGEAYRQTLEED